MPRRSKADGNWMSRFPRQSGTSLSKTCRMWTRSRRKWISASARLTCPRKRSAPSRKRTRRQRPLLFPTTAPTAGPRMSPWSFRRSILNIPKSSNTRRRDWAQREASSPSSPTAPSRAIRPPWQPGRNSSPMRSSYPPIRRSPAPARTLPPGRKWSAM